MNIDYDKIHAAARRERALAIHRLVFAAAAAVAALFRRVAWPEPRKRAAAFPIARSC